MDEIGTAAPASVYLFCPGKAGKAKFATFEPKLADGLVSHMLD